MLGNKREGSSARGPLPTTCTNNNNNQNPSAAMTTPEARQQRAQPPTYQTQDGALRTLLACHCGGSLQMIFFPLLGHHLTRLPLSPPYPKDSVAPTTPPMANKSAPHAHIRVGVVKRRRQIRFGGSSRGGGSVHLELHALSSPRRRSDSRRTRRGRWWASNTDVLGGRQVGNVGIQGCWQTALDALGRECARNGRALLPIIVCHIDGLQQPSALVHLCHQPRAPHIDIRGSGRQARFRGRRRQCSCLLSLGFRCRPNPR